MKSLFSFTIVALVAISSAAVVSRQTGSCGECRFSLCGGDSIITPTFPVDRALTSAICLDGVTVGHVDETGEANVDGITPISKYMPDGLMQAFSPSFFKGYSVDGGEESYETSGVGHEYPQANQLEYLDGICLALPIREYQIVDPKTGVVLQNIATSDSMDCVSFTVTGVATDGGDVAAIEISPTPESVF